MEPDDDGELMLRYARGDLRAFETLYQRHRGGLYRYLARQTRNPEAASDLFQEVWSKVIASRERYEPRAKFQTFLYRVAHNCFVDYCRRSSARPEINGDAQEGWQETLTAPEDDRPDLRAEQAETVARYKAALAALPAEQRDVFLLYEESGLSLEEIAAITAVGPETAKSRLRYAVSKLRQAMAAGSPPPALTERPERATEREARESPVGKSTAGTTPPVAERPAGTPTPMVMVVVAPAVAVDAIQEGG